MNTSDLKTWKDFAKHQKESWVQCTDRGDLHPTTIAEKDGVVLCFAVAPQVNKHMGLWAARVMRGTMDADAITVIFDAHMAAGKPGETQEDFAKRYPPGSMQKMCDEEGACETGAITDCLLCFRITVDKKVMMTTLPYSYHGKGTTFKWFPETEVEDYKSAGGFIPESLGEIMDGPTFKDIPEWKELTERFEFSPERAAFHTTRVGMQIIAKEEFVVFDGVSPKHPEWIKEEDE